MAGTVTIRLISISSGALVTGLAAFLAASMKFSAMPMPTLFEPPIIESAVLDRKDPPKPQPATQRESLTPIQAAPIIVATIADPPALYDGPDVVADPQSDILAGFAGGAPRAVITTPDWIRRPSDLAAYYPERALDRGREGEVILDCVVGVDGRLGCTILSETPAGWNFGAAALAIARDHEMAPATRDGAPVEAQYRMRVPFTLAD
ncbi:MAG: TonB family protein [Hyphomonadaceae bacterium]|nr:TonB family protein [Hyphomonadaceae bacterium]